MTRCFSSAPYLTGKLWAVSLYNRPPMGEGLPASLELGIQNHLLSRVSLPSAVTPHLRLIHSFSAADLICWCLEVHLRPVGQGGRYGRGHKDLQTLFLPSKTLSLVSIMGRVEERGERKGSKSFFPSAHKFLGQVHIDTMSAKNMGRLETVPVN